MEDTDVETEEFISAAQKAQEKQRLAIEYPNAVFINEATSTYNCHAYAWHMVEGGTAVWIGVLSSSPTDIYWTDGSYMSTSVNDAKKVSYASDNHSAITTDQADYFKSKWGSSCLVKHHKSYCPYDATDLRYYKRRPLYLDVWNNSTGLYLGNTSSGINLCPNTTYHLKLNSDAAAYLTDFRWTVPTGWTVFYTETNGLISINTNSVAGGRVVLSAKSRQSGSISRDILTAYFNSSSSCPNSFSLYPNPAKDVVTIELKGLDKSDKTQKQVNTLPQEYEIQIWDQSSLRKSIKTYNEKIEIPIMDLNKGYYFVRVIRMNHVETETLIIK